MDSPAVWVEGLLLEKSAEDIVAGELSVAFERVLELVGADAPRDGNYALNCLRIGEHTEQMLLGIQYEARLEIFGWKNKRGDMPELYFDRTMRNNTDYYWVFGGTSVAKPTSIPKTPVA